ncbi:SDR family NAD(P)-dependent oxidoreductase [Dactylosporangium sp. AC04546]|uniref:SDR family NAD(P)-dependent oxidoreductase n=1 Tax=Dactylosporangium sp. AC04546 TaxID=2862460 RepID=UPI001EE09A5A|nr:SDR family NAD(P)-dependent oxidoreductase [Dactylosporangium sp. AC04546]WVK87278.1 SDR family NAD(P)-dependent oxidoreductase [Dactylosporangium sp. AC04546]
MTDQPSNQPAHQLRFDDRVAIVTGAGGGLGRAYALLLASRGAHVVVNDIDRKDDSGTTPAASVAAEINGLGGSAVAHDGSIAEPSAGPAVVDTAMQAFGRVDIVVNNAGIVRDRSFGKMSDQEVKDVLDVHLHGTIGLTRAAWNVLRERQYGRVVMTTSVAGLWGNLGQANYSAAKAGLVGLGRTLAVEGARHGIRVNLISPGAATAMTSAMLPEHLHERMSPDRVAPMVAYLCHESCTLTGEILFAAAGRYARNLIIETAGYENPDATVEDIATHLPDILDTTSWTVPAQAVQLPPG